MLTLPFLVLGLASVVNSQTPTICQTYAAKLGTGNATDLQTSFITQFVANVFGGNSSVFGGTAVPGVLTAGTYNNKTIRLAKYFDGSMYSTNSISGQPQAVNWMDDGGAITLNTGKIANSNTSNQ
jgi:hypothetical protein